MTSKNKRQQKRRNRLFREHPYCSFCDVKLVIVSGPHIKFFPDNAATIEHKLTRLNPARGVHYSSDYQTVLACRKCNLARGRIAELKAGIAELRRRSQRYGRSHPAT